MINNNAQNLIKQVLSSADTVGLLQAKDVDGTTRYIADFSAYPSSVEDNFTLVAANAGISVGSGSTTATDSDYQLVSTITSGLTGNVVSSNNVDSNGNASITFSVTLTNTSSSNILVSEIGYKQEISASDTLNGTTATNRVFLLDRSVFDTVTITPGSQAIIDYTLKAVVTNEGGAVGTKSITANGTYNAINDNLDGYSTVTVNVQALLGTKSITSNGTYNASGDSLEGYSSVTVNVSPNVGIKNISTNGIYNASGDSLDGYSSVVVAVNPNVNTKSVTANGIYNASSDNLDGYSSVTVAVSPNVSTKSITSNGTYTASSEQLDGYSEVTVNVSGSGTLGTKTIYEDGTYDAQDDNLDGYSEVTVHTNYTLATPLMTSNITPSGEVSASSEFDGSGTYDAWYAFSAYCGGNQQTWVSEQDSTIGEWIQYEFPTAQIITKLITVNRNEEDLFPSSYDNGVPRTFIFQGSNDDTNWTGIQTCNITSDSGHHKQVFIINNSTAYLYYRLYITDSYSNNYVGFAQVQMYKDAPPKPYLIDKGITGLTFNLTNGSGGAYANAVTDGITVYPHLGAWGALIDVTEYNDIIFIINTVSNAENAYIGVGDTLEYSASGANLDVKVQLATGSNLIYRLDVSSLTGNKYLQFSGGSDALATIESIIAS